MPLYDYRCMKCGAVVEYLVPFDDKDEVRYCERGDYAAQPCDGKLERLQSRIAYPGIVDKRMKSDEGRTPIHHNRGGPR